MKEIKKRYQVYCNKETIKMREIKRKISSVLQQRNDKNEGDKKKYQVYYNKETIKMKEIKKIHVY